MFDAQTAALIRSAPILAGVDPAMLPQELTGIYAELAGLRLRAAALAEQPDDLAQLERIERIATIYEALVDNGAEDHERRAAAFVAATAYQLLGRSRPDLEERDQLLTARAIDPRVSAPLLFLIAEQTPDAREAARELAGPRLEDIHRGALVESIEDLALERFEAVLERADRLSGLRPGADAPFDERATQALYGLCWSGVVQMVAQLLDRPLVELAYQQFATPQQIATLPSTVCGWMEWLIDFMIADRPSYVLLFGPAVETVKAVTRGKKTGGDSTPEEMTLLKTALAAWLKGEPFYRIETSLGVAAAKIGVCKRTRDLVNKIANRQLYMVAAAAAEVLRQTLAAKEGVAANPAVLEILAYAIRHGLDSPEKVAFAYRTQSARSRVILHRAFAGKVGDRPPVLGADFEQVMRHLDAVLAFGSLDLSDLGSIDGSPSNPLSDG